MKTFVKIWLGIALVAMGFGIILLIVVVASGGTVVDMPTVSYQESYSDIRNVDMDIEYGEVKIVEGNEFSIDAENIPEDSLESSVSNGTWTVKQHNEKEYSIFGGRVDLGGFWGWRWWDHEAPQITITLPSDFIADNFQMYIGAGDVKVEKILASEADFVVSAGILVIDEAAISGASKYNVGAGSMELMKLQAKDITVDCGVGNVFIEGAITGYNDITCGVGSVNMKLEGSKDDYSYEIESGIGNINIDNDNYHSISDKSINNNGALGNFSLDCSVGNITVDFQ